MAKEKKDEESPWIFWLAFFLIIIGVLAVIMLALHALGVI